MNDMTRELARLVAELESLRGRLAATLDASSDLMFRVDRTGRILDFHASAQIAPYLKPEEFLGRRVGEVLPADAAATITGALAEARVAGRHQGAIYALPGPRGEHWYELSVVATGDSHAADAEFVALVRDITERRQAETERQRYREELERTVVARTTELHEALRQYRDILQALETGGMAFGIFDLETGRILSASARCAELLGYAPAELIAMKLSALAVDVTDDGYQRTARRIRARGAIRFETTLRRKDGRVVPVDAAIVHHPADGEGAARGIAFFVDISRRRHAEERLQRSEERYRAVVQDQTEVIFRSDADGRLTFVNDTFCRFFGCRRSDVEGQVWHPPAVPDDHRDVPEPVATPSSEQPVVVVEKRVYDGAGAVRWMQFVHRAIFAADGRMVEVQAVGRDTTESRAKDEALRHSEQVLAMVQQSAQVGVWELDVATGATYWSPECRRLYDAPPDQPITDAFWRSCVHPADLPRIDAQWAESIARGEPFDVEFRIRSDTGGERWLLSRGSAKYDAAGRPVRVLGINLDITARKQAEAVLAQAAQAQRSLNEELARRVQERTAELQMQHEKLQAILDASGEGIVSMDDRGIVRTANRAVLRMFGLEIGEVVGALLEGAEPAPDAGLGAPVPTRVRLPVPWPLDPRSGSRGGLGDAVGIRKDGTPFPVAVQWSDVRMPEGRLWVVVLRDLSLQRRMEEELRARLEDIAQMHRLYSMGEIAGVLAHQINQPLAAIRANADAGLARLRRDSLPPAKATETLHTIVVQSERAAQSIRELRSFIARESLEFEDCDLGDLVRETGELMTLLARDGRVALDIDLPAVPVRVAARPKQVEQVLIILIQNAIDACRTAGGRRRWVRVECAPADDGATVCVTVSDSGPGVEPALAERVFQPFFTTKAQGVGLGLSIARTIVGDHGGRIWVESGAGGRFRFTLPRSGSGTPSNGYEELPR